ncbi:N-acetylaspartate synthetase [Oryzias melastigma]|uniref:N-acetylaspartate synthetase n=1 Tax=Oryzias melastigma TaxID=30732 RepID=A0A834FBA5_ORYME|nr:N-acetylaspartate synthetase [Oryzias melastigma]
MHFSSPKMVCETKIVADEHEAIPGTKKEAMMWGSPPSSGAALSPAEPPKDGRKDGVFIREFERGDEEEVRRIFCEGIMERIPNTAFRGIKQQPRIQFLYALLTVMCFYVTKSVTLTCCAPLILMGARLLLQQESNPELSGVCSAHGHGGHRGLLHDTYRILFLGGDA